MRLEIIYNENGWTINAIDTEAHKHYIYQLGHVVTEEVWRLIENLFHGGLPTAVREL